MSPSTSTLSTTKAPTFEDLGLRTVVNCYGTYTIFSGSRALAQVAEAMVEATNAYVQMDELMDAVGKRLAELTGAQWGYITSGCAAALTQVSAACIVGADPELMMRLPQDAGHRCEVIMQKGHRNSYDWAIRMTGARMVEVETLADYRAALGDATALVAITGDLEEHGSFAVQDMINLAKRRGVPVLVDAAAQRPDVPNRYLEMGADVVLYSGGKCLRGPQAAGLALGRKDILQAAFLNGAPHHAIGRPMKAGKEEIMGLLAAIEAWILGRDHEAEWRMWEGYLEEIRQAVAELPSITTEIKQPGMANHAPQLAINWDPGVLNLTPHQAHAELLEGDPRVAMHLTPTGLRVMPYMMEDGDAAIAARRLREVLCDRPSQKEGPDAGSPAKVSGDWLVTIKYVLGQSVHSLHLEQDGSTLSGTYRSQYDKVPVEGQIVGNRITMSVVLGYQINRVRYGFEGTVSGGHIKGDVSLGEFGGAVWSAEAAE